MKEEVAKQLLAIAARAIQGLAELNPTEQEFEQMRSDPAFAGLTDLQYVAAVRAVTNAKAANAALAEQAARERVSE